MLNIVGLIIGIAMAVWAYQVVNRHGGKRPWLWAAGAFFVWPVVILIAGIKYDETAMIIVGGLGLFFIVASFIGLGIFMLGFL